jgi:hypothetical protein
MRNRSLARSVRGILPIIVTLSFLGCIVGLFFRIPLNALGVAVAVPLCVGFVVTRILISIVPRAEKSERDAPRSTTKLDYVLVGSLVLSLYGSIVFLASAGVYSLIGVTGMMVGALELSLGLLALSILFFLLELLAITSRTLSLPEVVEIIAIRAVLVFWISMHFEASLFARGYGVSG